MWPQTRPEVAPPVRPSGQAATLRLPTPEQCRRWWDLLASAVLLLSAQGESMDGIAGRLGVELVEVERVLVPVAPRPCDWRFLAREVPQLAIYSDVVRGAVDRVLSTVMLKASWQAAAADDESLARTLRASAALAATRAEAGESLLAEWNVLDARAVEACAFEDARAALGIEPLSDPGDWLFFRFARARHVAALVEAAQAHVEAGKPLPKLRAVLAKRTRARDFLGSIDGADQRIADVAAVFGAPIEGT